LAGEQVILHVGLLVAMLAFNLWSYTKSNKDLTQRFFAAFQIAAAIPFALAFPARALDLWGYLRLMPLRSFPLMVPLLFFFQVFCLARRLARPQEVDRRKRRSARRTSALVLAAAFFIAIVPTSPLLAAPRLIHRNYVAWTTTDHVAEAFNWVRENTPKNVRCIVPVDRQDAFDRTERAQVANWQAIPYDRLSEWKHRINELVGGAQYFSGSNYHGDLPNLRAAYNKLTTAQIDAIAAKYHMDCLVSETRYPYQLLHQSGPVHVYALKPF
jgi:hypothetical protein